MANFFQRGENCTEETVENSAKSWIINYKHGRKCPWSGTKLGSALWCKDDLPIHMFGSIGRASSHQEEDPGLITGPGHFSPCK